MASICNDERVTFGVLSGHERKTLRLSDLWRCQARRQQFSHQGVDAAFMAGGALSPGTAKTSLEGMPRGIALKEVTSSMCQVNGVLDVHDVHVWSLGSGAHALSCHALIEDMPPSESACILLALNNLLTRQFEIRHTTIQFEHARCAVSEHGCAMAPMRQDLHSCP